MDNRLNKYRFKTIKECNKHAAKWIADHPMDCIVWAAQQCNRDDHDRSTVESADEYVTGLTKEDKQAIMTLDLEEDYGECIASEDVVSETNQVHSSEEEEDDEVLKSLEKAYEDCTSNMGKRNMIKSLINQRKDINNNARRLYKEAMSKLRERRKDTLREMGVDETLVNLFPSSLTATIPEQLQNEIDVRVAEKQREEAAKEHQRQQKIFENPWLHKTEQELSRLQLEVEQCPEGDEKRAKQYILTACSDSIKAFH